VRIPAVVLFDASNRATYASEGALRVVPMLKLGERVTYGSEVYRVTVVPLTSLGGGAEVRTAVIIDRPSNGTDLASTLSKYRLTPRERQVLELLLEGLSTKEIGGRLGISPNTAKAFVRIMAGKVGVTGRTALITTLVRDVLRLEATG
jgi:DNA-binding CsgD family transcriptional regulator